MPPSDSEQSQIQLTIRSLPVFAGLPGPTIERLAEICQLLAFQTGDSIQTPGDLVLIITAGEVNCFISDAANQKFLLGTAGHGEILGELPHLTRGSPHEQKILLQAVTPVMAIGFTADIFFKAVSSHPAAMLSLCSILARRLAAMNRFAKTAVDIDIDPTNLQAHTFGERMADWMSAKIGSWQFLFGGMVFVCLWALFNVLAFSFTWDPYPFIFLNLVFSLVSAATMPVLLISQNRQSQLDRFAARANQHMTLRAAQLTARVLKELRRLGERVDKLTDK